jgi:hypothetical protein
MAAVTLGSITGTTQYHNYDVEFYFAFSADAQSAGGYLRAMSKRLGRGGAVGLKP